MRLYNNIAKLNLNYYYFQKASQELPVVIDKRLAVYD